MSNPESKFFFAEKENNHKRENVDNKRLGRQIESICKAIGMESVSKPNGHKSESEKMQ